MSGLPIRRFFRLSDAGVRCDADGLFVGGAPILVRSPRPGGSSIWTPRPAKELDDALRDVYGLPIDSGAKRGGLTSVARALGTGDLALSKIAAVLLRFPDPPALAKNGAESESVDLARQLFESGLLKWGWDPALHPRTGQPPNPGWFAPTDDESNPSPATWRESPTEDELRPRLVNDTEPPEDEPPSKLPAPIQSPREILRSIRNLLREARREEHFKHLRSLFGRLPSSNQSLKSGSLLWRFKMRSSESNCGTSNGRRPVSTHRKR